MSHIYPHKNNYAPTIQVRHIYIFNQQLNPVSRFLEKCMWKLTSWQRSQKRCTLKAFPQWNLSILKHLESKCTTESGMEVSPKRGKDKVSLKSPKRGLWLWLSNHRTNFTEMNLNNWFMIYFMIQSFTFLIRLSGRKNSFSKKKWLKNCDLASTIGDAPWIFS